MILMRMLTILFMMNQKRSKNFTHRFLNFFTTRNVVSGLLAAGPDVVGKRKQAFKIVQKNAEQFVREIKIELK